MGQLICFLTINYGMPGNEPHFWLVLLSCVFQVSLNLNIMHYYVGILLIYRYVWMINEQLKEQVNRMKLNPTATSSRIKGLLFLYNRLLELNKKLIAAYELHMILILTSWLAGNIVVIYFLIVYGISMRKYSFFLIAFPQSLLINSWDFWLTITICNLTEKAGQKTSNLLQLFSDLDYKDDQLERSVSTYIEMYCYI